MLVAGTPLDFRLSFGGADGQQPAAVVHLADDAAQLATHVALTAGVSGDLTLALDGLRAAVAIHGVRTEVAGRFIEPAGRDLAGPAQGVRLGRAVLRQRGHRPRDRVPADQHRGLTHPRNAKVALLA